MSIHIRYVGTIADDRDGAPIPDDYIPRNIPRYEYETVCETSQHFTETYEQYCDRIHAQERTEYLRLKFRPDAREIMSAVVQGRDEDFHLVYFIVNRHYLGKGKCTRTYTPTHLDKHTIAEVGEEVFRQVVRKCDGKEILDL